VRGPEEGATGASVEGGPGVDLGLGLGVSGEGEGGKEEEGTMGEERDVPRLASRNPPPIQEYGEETGRRGSGEVWKRRK